MSRADAPADLQWARALTAVAVSLVIASGLLCPLSSIPCQLMNIVIGVQ